MVSARLVTSCGSITLPQQPVWVGTPNHDYISITGDGWVVPRKSIFSAAASRQMYIDNYQWDLPYGFTITRGQGTNTIHFDASSGFGSDYYGLQLTNTCGIGSRNYMMYEAPTMKNLVLSPNPTSGETTVTIEKESAEEPFDETAAWDLEVYNASQLLKEKLTGLRGQSTTIETAGWKEGVYLVRVMYKGELLTGKLVVKR